MTVRQAGISGRASNYREPAQVPDAPTRTGAPQFMFVPSLSCPARCSYCFGPHEGPLATPQTVDAAVDLFDRVADETGQDKVQITLHGGEPLMAGPELLGHALEQMRARLGRHLDLGIQSNLWLLSESLCELLGEHKVSLGTSVDGPEAITDRQRGLGYFARTMAGVDLARSRGLSVSSIATFTSVSDWSAVLAFFASQRLSFAVHPAVPVPGDLSGAAPSLAPAAYGELLVFLLDAYVTARRDVKISTLDQMSRGVLSGHGKVCTFQDCLGRFLVVDPTGDIYSCQRFIGHPEFRLGHLSDAPDLGTLLASPAARRLANWQESVSRLCGDCEHLAYCRGGCPYNAWVADPASPGRDPYCVAYGGAFEAILNRLGYEASLPANVEAVAREPYTGDGHPFFRRGPLIELARGGPHPTSVARNARRVVAAVELARGPDLQAVAVRLQRMGLCRTPQTARESLLGLRREMLPAVGDRKNLYLHVTGRCQLSCAHCYSDADAAGAGQPDLSIETLERLVCEAREQGFRQVVLTGGEPLMHPDRQALLERLRRLRPSVEPLALVLCTNLALPLKDDELLGVGHAFHEIVVSVDGDEQTHDDLRGPGSHATTVANLRRRQTLLQQACISQELSLWPVMEPSLRDQEPGLFVKKLGQELGAARTRFHSVKPLGRARNTNAPTLFGDPMQRLAHGFSPRRGCGLGQSLHVESGGDTYPCYALCHPRHLLGNVIADGLAAIMDGAPFANLCACTVDTNRRCRSCDVRYLCGGPCRAWDPEAAAREINDSEQECSLWQARARELLSAAREYLELP